MAPRVAVLVRPVEGGHQAVCQTRDCAEGPGGTAWRSAVYTVKSRAEVDARGHRQWHRHQRPVPAGLPEWASLTDIGDGRYRLDLDGNPGGIRVKGHATGSLDATRKLVAAIKEAAAAQAAGGGA